MKYSRIACLCPNVYDYLTRYIVRRCASVLCRLCEILFTNSITILYRRGLHPFCELMAPYYVISLKDASVLCEPVSPCYIVEGFIRCMELFTMLYRRGTLRFNWP
eukprot:323359_1